MSTIGNILWFLFGGLIGGLAWVLKPHSDEVGRMMLNGFHALAHYVLPVLFTQMELCAESRLL